MRYIQITFLLLLPILAISQTLNVSSFENGYTTGIIFDKVFKGENEFKLKIYKFKFHEVVMDSTGTIVEYLSKRDHIQMIKRRYEMPKLRSKLLSEQLIALRSDNNRWEIRKIDL